MSAFNLDPKTMDEVVQGRAVLAFVLNRGTPQEEEIHAGIVTVANIEGTDEPTEVWSPNGDSRVKAGELPGEKSFTFTYTTQSITPDVRVLSVMGLKREGGLPAIADWSKDISKPVAGRRVDLGRPIPDAAVAGMVKGENFDLIENDEVILFKVVPANAPATVKITGTAAAIPGAIIAEMGRSPTRKVSMVLRSFETDKRPYRIEMPLGLQRISGEFGLIGENDAVEAEIEVELLADQTGSFGKLTVYPAKAAA
jgi:hypothetical protein